MKPFIKILYLFTFILLSTSCERKGAREYDYSGIIIDKGYEAPTSGYKSNTDPSYFVMMKEDKSQKTIRINVTIPTWYKLNKGNRTTFTLSNWDLYYNGNTTDMTKNLYEE